MEKKYLDYNSTSQLVKEVKSNFSFKTHAHPVDSALSASSTNPVQNKVLNTVLIEVADTLDDLQSQADSAKDTLSSHTGNTTNHITSAERTKWNQVITDLDTLEKVVSDKANATHSHTISDITNLQNTLNTMNDEIDDCITGLSVSGKVITYTKNDGSTGTITTQDNNTDTKVKNTLATTTKAYITGTTSSETNTGTQVFDTGVYLDTIAGQLVATTFKGALDGNAKTATSATKAISDQNGMDIDRGYCSMVPFGTAIGTNQDLNTNTYLKVGNYYCSANKTVETLTNCPTTSAFMMQVYSPLSTTIDNESTKTWCYRLRKMLVYTGEEYTQYVYSGSTAGTFTFGAWKQIIKTGDTASVAEKLGTTTVGSATQPVYLNSGTATACTYTLEKSVPSDAVFTDTDTKNTAGSTNSSSKLFLIGATSQAANPQTYSHDTAYVGTDGHLYSNSKQVVNLSDTQALTNKTYNGYTLAEACAKGVTDSTSTGAIGTGSNLVTERDVYYGLPTINGVHNYTSSTTIFAPTAVGTSGQVLKSNGSGAPSWIAPSSLTVGTAGTLTGLTASVTELNYCDGLTSNIQTQLNNKSSTSHTHPDPSSIELNSSGSLKGYGGFIDFHYVDSDGTASSNTDYSSRIIESSDGVLSVNNVTISKDKLVTATTFKGALDGNAKTATSLSNFITLTSSGSDNAGKYIKFARITASDAYTGFAGQLTFTAAEHDSCFGILEVYLRTGSSVGSVTYNLKWLALNNPIYVNSVCMVKVSDGIFDLYYKPLYTYDTMMITVIGGNSLSNLSLINSGSYVSSVTPICTSSTPGKFQIGGALMSYDSTNKRLAFSVN